MADQPTTPAEWLPILTDRLDKQVKDIERPRRYAHGKPDLPEMGKNLKASWERFQKKSRTDYGGAAVRSLRNRIRFNGFRIGDTDDHPALPIARRIARNNRLSIQIKKAVGDAIETKVGYLTVRLSSTGDVMMRREKPEQFYGEPDPETPWRAVATVKVWRDRIRKKDYARVSAAGASQLFWRDSENGSGTEVDKAAGSTWEAAEAAPQIVDGSASVAILDVDGPFLGPHMDTIDRINLGKLQRLVTTAMQAFRQRAVRAREGSGGLPAEDEQGNTINWSVVFEPAPGALWELPEGIDIWESEHTDIRPMLEGEKTDARDFCAASGTPISVLIPDGQNQSAEGAANAKEQQIEQARDIIDMVTPSIEQALVYALQAAGADLSDDATVQVLFAPPEHVSLSERYAAAVQAKAAGLSARTIKRDILGMTPDQIAQDEADAGADMLAAALLGVTAPAASSTPQVDNGADAGAA